MNNTPLTKEEMEYLFADTEVYGDAVRKIAGIVKDTDYGYCLTDKCRHFDPVEFNCTKKHHCDCDCPECSPESYI